MDQIRQHVGQCLALKPKFNNLVQLLGLLHTSCKIKDKTFCARQLARVFTHYNQQALFSSQVGGFIKSKLSSFLQLLTILSQQDPIFVECIDQVIKFGNPHDVSEASSAVDGFWASITNAETAGYLIGSMLTRPCSQRIRCLLDLPSTMLYLNTVNDTETKLKRTTEEKPENRQIESKFKKAYQSLLFSVLKDQELEEKDKRVIIKNFGEKIFGKIQSPLIMSEYILKLFRSTQDLELKIDLLSALFILIGRYQLEMDDLYGELYNLLTTKGVKGESVYEASNSKRVFKMLENSLRSSKVPFTIMTKFLKCLLQQCTLNNSEFTCWVLALSFNLFKKHSLLQSCLNPRSQMYIPEFKLLSNHYLPQVKTIVAKLHKSLTKEDFLDISEFTEIDLKKLLRRRLESQTTAKIDIPSRIDNLIQM